MNDNTRTLELSTGRRQGTEGLHDIYDDLMDAVDLASDQDRRTVITAGGKRIAAIVTAEDLERLEAPDPGKPATREFWQGAAAKVRAGEIIWLTDISGRAYGAIAPASRIQGGVPTSFRPSPPPPPPPDAVTRIAMLFGSLYRDGVTGSWRGLPLKPEGMTIEQHIERWLRNG